MRTIKTYFKGAPFYNAFLTTWPASSFQVSYPGQVEIQALVEA
jgi:hypothetical protein